MTSRNRGDHLSGRGGSSTEFSDYRDYSPGDDMRYIDWNIFSRLQKPYLKQFHLEEEMHIVIIIDATSSMKFDDKFVLAQKLAAAFTTISLFSNEKVSLYAINQQGLSIPENIGPMNDRFNQAKAFNFIENLKCEGNETLESGLAKVCRQHTGKGMALILSDFLSSGDLQKSFNLLFSKGLAPYALQILSPMEITPQVNGDARFVDSETTATLDISAAGQLVDIYLEYLTGLQDQLKSWANKRNGLFYTTSSETQLEKLLFDTLVRRRWIK